MRQAGEPSVEAILESIKQVIARDNRMLMAGDSLPERGADIDSDAARVGDESAEVLDLADSEFAAPVDSIDEKTDASPEPAEDAAPSLAAESTHGAVRGSLVALALAAEAGPPADRPGPAPGDAPFEALVREMLQPALADWLDRHLPAMVERLVAAEIARIVGKRG